VEDGGATPQPTGVPWPRPFTPSMDTTVVGEVAAQAMERLAEEFGDDVTLVAIGVVVIADVGDQTFTRVFSNRTRHFEHVGLFTEALDAVNAPTDIDE
jgi:hypothetical protein